MLILASYLRLPHFFTHIPHCTSDFLTLNIFVDMYLKKILSSELLEWQSTLHGRLSFE